MDFKWTLSRPGIALEFETGSIKEAIGILEEEETQISEIFGYTKGNSAGYPVDTGEIKAAGESVPAIAAPAPEKKKPGRPVKVVEAVAPDPIPVPAAASLTPPPPLMPSPPISAEPGPNGVPAFLDRTTASTAPPAAPSTASTLPAPLLSPPPLPTPPPVGVWGPKVVAVLDEHKKNATDDGVALSDWLALTGLTIKGASYDDACRAVLMISDDKIVATGILPQLGLA